MRLAIVIPTLDEEDWLTAILPHAIELADRVCVSDGGSTDATVDVARSLGARVVTGPPGRGVQLNRGARAAGCDLLLFLHADTRLPDAAADLVRDAVADGAVGGGFEMRFTPDRGMLWSSGRLVSIRSRLTGCPLGDQSQFTTREAFTALGGFREWPILEDLDFIRRLKRHGRTVVLAEPVVTSARRYVRRGAARASLVNHLIWGLYLAGVSPLKLARLYEHVR